MRISDFIRAASICGVTGLAFLSNSASTAQTTEDQLARFNAANIEACFNKIDTGNFTKHEWSLDESRSAQTDILHCDEHYAYSSNEMKLVACTVMSLDGSTALAAYRLLRRDELAVIVNETAQQSLTLRITPNDDILDAEERTLPGTSFTKIEGYEPSGIAKDGMRDAHQIYGECFPGPTS